jgi:hypothetical protein
MLTKLQPVFDLGMNMKLTVKPLLYFGFVLNLVACGGGGGGTSNPGNTTPPPPTPSQIIQDAQSYSVAQLTTAATKLADDGYKGKTSAATMNADISQRVFSYLFNDSLGSLPDVGNENIEGQIDNNGIIDVTFACDIQGSAKYKGKLNSSTQGNVSITYKNCQQIYSNYVMTGSVAMSIAQASETIQDFTVYFDNFSWTYEGQNFNLSGYSRIFAQDFPIENRFKYTISQHVLHTINNQDQTLIDVEYSIDSQNNNDVFNLSGEITLADSGKVTFSFEDVDGFPPYIYEGKMLLTGDKAAALEFGSEYIRYVQDSNDDNVFDIGTYFVDIYELLNGDASEKQLVDLANLSLPPQAYSPNWNNYGSVINTTTPIEVSEGYYFDPDDAPDDLQVSFRWYINDVIVPNLNTNTLPARMAVFGDLVSVTMLVSDGVNVVESSKLNFTLEDAPAEIRISNLPDVVYAGDIVQFVAEISDPDVQQNGTASQIISGPDGAEIDASGLVTWSVPTDFLFPFQTYTFSFGLPDGNGHISDVANVSLRVDSDKALTLARSGINVPQYNKSMWVGDFDGDGQNEVLSTDSRGTVFLLSFDGTSYQQTWVYPYKVGNDANIKQVLAVNVDDDIALEILVVTDKRISVINGLNSIASTLLSTESFLKFVTVADINQDGRSEIAYLSSSSQYSNDSVMLNVVSIATPETILFSTNVSGANQIQFANVDADSNIELVTNNGLVYDTNTWQNQWFSGTSFGDTNVTAGDYNGDGIDEIAGANNWGSLAVYSAVNKSQLDSFDNFNTCSLDSADLDADGSDELIVGDCQWGNINVYKLVNNKLELLWSVDMQDHGSTSLTSGDSDNDGQLELHWGTGISSSGEDKFVTADVSSEGLQIKQDAITSQLDGYSSAGWANLSDNQERAVFFVPSTQSGYGGSKIVTLDATGSYEVSAEVSSNWDYSQYAAVTDFNNDGLGDIFVPSTSWYDGSFAALQLNDNSVLWQTSGNYDSDIGLIVAYDFNGDGSDDAIYADRQVLKVIDVDNQNIIANYTFGGYIKDFVPLRTNDTENVLVAFGEKLSFLQLNGAVFSEVSFVNQTCQRLELINYDSDAELELICLNGETSSYFNQELVIFDLNNNTLSEISRHVLATSVLDFAVDPSTVEQQNIFLVTEDGKSRSYWENTNQYQINKATTTGNIIWSSPALVGVPTPHGLKVRKTSNTNIELMLSTDSLMYWIK